MADHSGPDLSPGDVLVLTVASGGRRWKNGQYTGTWDSVSGIWRFDIAGSTCGPLAFGWQDPDPNDPDTIGAYALAKEEEWPNGVYGTGTAHTPDPFEWENLSAEIAFEPGSGGQASAAINKV